MSWRGRPDCPVPGRGEGVLPVLEAWPEADKRQNDIDVTPATGQTAAQTTTFPDGHQECRRADNTRAWEMRNGVTTTYGADGNTAVAKSTLSGITVTIQQDQSQVIDLPNGYRVTINAAGNAVSAIDTLNADASVACTIDGGRNVEFASGWKLEWDLTWDTLYGPFHPRTRLHPDNKVDTLAYDGALVCRDAFGNPTAIQLPDSPPPATVDAVLQGDGTWLATRDQRGVPPLRRRRNPDGHGHDQRRVGCL